MRYLLKGIVWVFVKLFSIMFWLLLNAAVLIWYVDMKETFSFKEVCDNVLNMPEEVGAVFLVLALFMFYVILILTLMPNA